MTDYEIQVVAEALEEVPFRAGEKASVMYRAMAAAAIAAYEAIEKTRSDDRERSEAPVSYGHLNGV